MTKREAQRLVTLIPTAKMIPSTVGGGAWSVRFRKKGRQFWGYWAARKRAHELYYVGYIGKRGRQRAETGLRRTNA